MLRSRDFSLTRAYFFPREAVILTTTNIPIECMFCKNFYTFALVFFAFGLPQNWGQNVENADLRPKKCRFLSKIAIRRRKPISSLLCRKRAERHTELVFWVQKCAKRTKKRHFWRKLKIYPISLKFSALCKITSIFEEKNFAFRCAGKLFCKALCVWLSNHHDVILRFCVFANANVCMGNNPIYYIIKYLIIK